MSCNDSNCSNTNCQCSHAACECHPVYPQDNPCRDEDFDGTDAACPAWWRGADDGVVAVVRVIHKTLDALQCGEEPPRNFGSSEINGLVERIESLYKMMKA